MKEIKIKTDIGVFVFGATNFVNDVEADRINLKRQIEEGVVLIGPEIKFIGCFRKEKKKK